MIRFLQQSGQTTKYVLGGLLLIICASMVITLIPGGLGGDLLGGGVGKGYVAKVDGTDISADEVRQTARQMLQQQMPQGSSANMSMLLPFFSQRAAEQLITRQALIAQAKRLGLRVGPEEVKEELQHGRYAATFFPGGNFIGQQEYDDMLQRANLTPTKFEASVADDLLLAKLQALISGTASVSENDIHEQFVNRTRK
jgi:peptidyl-prolyl cis-trans isomerase D